MIQKLQDLCKALEMQGLKPAYVLISEKNYPEFVSEINKLWNHQARITWTHNKNDNVNLNIRGNTIQVLTVFQDNIMEVVSKEHVLNT